MTNSEHPQGYDRDLNLRGILGFSLGVVGAILVASAGMWYASIALRDQRAAADPPPSIIPEARQSYEPPGPRLQDDPEKELDRLRAEEEQVLTSYRWADESAGVAQIPVERAMAIFAAEAARAPALPAAEQTIEEGLAPSRDAEETTQ